LTSVEHDTQSVKPVTGTSSPNVYPRYHAYLAALRLVKFPGVTATSPKVIGTFVLNLKSDLNVHL